MNLFQIIIGQYVVEFIGASVRFIISYLIAKMKGTKHIKFKKYWNNKRTNTYENLETETANRIAGGLFFAMIILLIFIL